MVSIQNFWGILRPSMCKVCQLFALRRQKFVGKVERNFASVDCYPKYSSEDQRQILQVLNKCTAEELSRFDVSMRRVKNLQQYRSEHGHFINLKQLLEVEGLGVHILERLCNSILYGKATGTPDTNVYNSKTVSTTEMGRHGQLVTPPFDLSCTKVLETVMGIHIGVSSITWACMDKGGTLLTWQVENLNYGTKKLHPTALYKMAVDIKSKLTEADVYILEDELQPVQRAKQLVLIPTSMHTQQLTAMLLVLLNQGGSSLLQHHTRVYFLKSRLPARLFRTLIGSERVSAQAVVEQIFECSARENKDASLQHFTSICVNHNIREWYNTKSSVDKEGLCLALLLTMAFMDLVLHRRPQSLSMIKNVRKRV